MLLADRSPGPEPKLLTVESFFCRVITEAWFEATKHDGKNQLQRGLNPVSAAPKSAQQDSV